MYDLSKVCSNKLGESAIQKFGKSEKTKQNKKTIAITVHNVTE